jgi:GNAT superfamily N-acetyltransferase
MISIRRARPSDAAAIGMVHATAWQSAYPGILPDDYLAALSDARLAAGYQRSIADRRDGHALFVAVAGGPGEPEIVGFASGGRSRRTWLAEGEIETLYLLDDYRDRGVGRRLMRATAAHLRAIGCRSVMLWVLAENPSRWFYQHLGGRPAARETIRVAGRAVEQMAFLWDPIDSLLAATAPAPER